MKIAMLGHKRIPSREGGVEIVVEELACRMVEKGHSVTVYNRRGKHVSKETKTTEKKPKQYEYEGIHVVTVPTFEKKSLNAIVYAFLATCKAVCGHFDVIHYHAEGPCAMLWMAKFFRQHTVATIHGLDWQRAKWGGFATRFLLFGEKMAAKYADEIIVLSKNMQHYFKETYDRDTIYIPNGISRPTLRKPEIIAEKYRLKKDSYILFLARLVPEKGLHYLIDAYEKLYTDKKLVIAGGSSHSTEYVKQIKKNIQGNSKIIMTGFVQGKELEELYSNAYLYVLPSDVEGMPISLLEAMSYGNCCVTSDISENENVIESYGHTFKKGSSTSLQKVLQEFIDHPEQVLKYKSNASDFVCNKYSWEDVTEQTIQLYKRKK